MKLIRKLLIWIVELFSPKVNKERKKHFAVFFESRFEEWKTKGYYYPVSDPFRLRNLLKEDIELIGKKILSIPSNAKTLPIKTTQLHIKDITENAWKHLINNFFEGLHYSFSCKDNKIYIHFGYPKDVYDDWF